MHDFKAPPDRGVGLLGFSVLLAIIALVIGGMGLFVVMNNEDRDCINANPVPCPSATPFFVVAGIIAVPGAIGVAIARTRRRN